MNSYTMHSFGTARQNERLGQAAREHEIRQSRRTSSSTRGAQTTDIPAKRPFAWVREAAASFTDRLITRSSVPHATR